MARAILTICTTGRPTEEVREQLVRSHHTFYDLKVPDLDGLTVWERVCEIAEAHSGDGPKMYELMEALVDRLGISEREWQDDILVLLPNGAGILGMEGYTMPFFAAVRRRKQKMDKGRRGDRVDSLFLPSP